MKPNDLVERNLGLVRAIASKVVGMAPASVSFDELVSCGNQGLVEAAGRFDPDRGVAFSTFAYYRIRGAIFDGLRFMTGAAHRPTALAARADEYLEGLAGEPAPRTAAAAAERLADVLSDLAVVLVVASDHVERAVDPTTPDPASVAERREELTLVQRAMGALPDKERALLELMYFEGLGLVEAGERLGLSRGWASKLHARALATLRREAEGEPATAPPESAIRV